jgi:hypothetical protein
MGVIQRGRSGADGPLMLMRDIASSRLSLMVLTASRRTSLMAMPPRSPGLLSLGVSVDVQSALCGDVIETTTKEMHGSMSRSRRGWARPGPGESGARQVHEETWAVCRSRRAGRCRS